MNTWVDFLKGHLERIPEPAAWLNNGAVVTAFRALSQRERHVLYLRMHLGLSQVEVAEVLGIETPRYGTKTQGRQVLVSRAEVSALRKLRTLLSPSTVARLIA